MKLTGQLKEALSEGKVGYSLFFGDKLITSLMGTEKTTKSELIARAVKEGEVIGREKLAYLKKEKNITIKKREGKQLVPVELRESMDEGKSAEASMVLKLMDSEYEELGFEKLVDIIATAMSMDKKKLTKELDKYI